MKNAVIMAGGKGTRMKSEKPKVLHEVLAEPLAEHVIHSLQKAGAERIITITGYHHKEVEKALAGQCEFALQEPQLGTGHAVMQVHQLNEMSGTVVVASGDCPCVRAETYAKMYEEIGGSDMAVLTAVPDDNGAYGRVVRRNDGTVEKIVEYKDANEEERKIREVNTGIYAFKVESLREGLKHLNNDNAQHEYYLTDLVQILQELGGSVRAVNCDDWKEVQGINDCVQLSEAEKYLQKRINEDWMRKGVTMVDPDTTYIGEEVQIGHDVLIHPGVSLYGKTVVHSGAVILPGFYGMNALIHENEKTTPFSWRID